LFSLWLLLPINDDDDDDDEDSHCPARQSYQAWPTTCLPGSHANGDVIVVRSRCLGFADQLGALSNRDAWHLAIVADDAVRYAVCVYVSQLPELVVHVTQSGMLCVA